MSYGDFQGVITLVLMAIFIGIVLWAYSNRRKKAFDEAANLVFADEQDKQHKHKREPAQHE
ncbi:cbb3-type cytochrome oxidase subunit 3 [Echinimonas agarilytica]|uniref:Cbb3-type cytochrome c oxidase subunit 3 n=1 Tax=Echinimonas agarilytica TaxID=1215918 RepID=A0AA42B8S5_9GAMM|nr:cbb3-type cytochrome c oxidase subunit 3 [Echinimonas agarilytica]MCM2681187.1 cbb3-type cytochrome c oxidase subunit 3 [Echinimonas agarilytica]